jgi:hypothetical protein
VTADEVMRLVREYAAGIGWASLEDQAAAYLAVTQAVEALAAPVKPVRKRAAGWAVLDAEDRVRLVTLDKDEATRTAGEAARDGYSVRPLVLADLDDVEVES